MKIAIEKELLLSPTIPESAGHSIDTLFDIIQGRAGTAAQRAAIIRILDDVTKKNPRQLFPRILRELNIQTLRHDGPFLHQLAPEPFPTET